MKRKINRSKGYPPFMSDKTGTGVPTWMLGPDHECQRNVERNFVEAGMCISKVKAFPTPMSWGTVICCEKDFAGILC
jgi:hypothetical protein